jgi:hypothetical protein
MSFMPSLSLFIGLGIMAAVVSLHAARAWHATRNERGKCATRASATLRWESPRRRSRTEVTVNQVEAAQARASYRACTVFRAFHGSALRYAR